GSYTQVFSGNNTYTGATDIACGSLILNGNQSASAVTVQNAAFLFGSGTIGPVTALSGAAISAGGLPPGSPPNGGPGLLSVIGALSMSSGSLFIADIDGTTVGTGYDRVAATGPASIAGVNLQVNVSGFAPTGGQTFTILTSSALTGTFAGQGEGSLATANGFGFIVHYTGTSVILTACTSLTNVSIGVTGSTTLCGAMGGQAMV